MLFHKLAFLLGLLFGFPLITAVPMLRALANAAKSSLRPAAAAAAPPRVGSLAYSNAFPKLGATTNALKNSGTKPFSTSFPKLGSSTIGTNIGGKKAENKPSLAIGHPSPLSLIPFPKPNAPAPKVGASVEQKANIPKVKPTETDPKTGRPRSYSGQGRTYADVVKHGDAAKSADVAKSAASAGFQDMKNQHEPFPKKTMPAVMASVVTNDMIYLHSSHKGGRTPEGQHPSHLTEQLPKNLLNHCHDAYGGKHGNGGNCAELGAINDLAQGNPGMTHFPPGTKVEAWGQVAGQKSSTGQSVAPCTGRGIPGDFGCKHVLEFAGLTPEQQKAKVDEERGKRGVPPMYSQSATAKPATEDDKSWTLVTKGNGKKHKRWESFDDELLELLVVRGFLDQTS